MQSVFNETPMTVVDARGSQVTVESPEGKTVTRNKSRVKRYHTDSETVFCRQEPPDGDSTEMPTLGARYPARQRREPERLEYNKPGEPNLT